MLKRQAKLALFLSAAWLSQAALAGELTLFSSEGFERREVTLRDGNSDLSSMRFNDRSESMIVRSGPWEVCVHSAFRGDEYGPRDAYNRRDGVELFSEPGFGGARVPVRDQVSTLNHLRFNDKAGSLIVYGGRWEFCQHSEFRGQCMTYGPGRYDRLGSLHNQISSIRRVR